MEGLDKIFDYVLKVDNIYTFLSLLVVCIIFLIIFVIKKYPSGMKYIYETIFRKSKFRTEFLESIKSLEIKVVENNSKTDEIVKQLIISDKENKEEIKSLKEIVSFLSEKMDTFIIFFKKEDHKKEIETEINNIIYNYLDDKQIKHSELRGLLIKISECSINLFQRMLHLGLESVNIDTIKDVISIEFKDLKTAFSVVKLGVDSNFNETIKNNILAPEIECYSKQFNIFIESGQKNGILFANFKKINLKFVKNTIIQVHQLFCELKKD
jgi:Sec-independent protein translocase protein TatA